jgi:hypothetical protein
MSVVAILGVVAGVLVSLVVGGAVWLMRKSNRIYDGLE